MKPRNIMLLYGCLLLVLVTLNIKPASAIWLDPEWAYRIRVDVTNSLSRSRTNVSMEINATNKDHVNADCSDIRMTTDDGVTPFIYFNITNSVDYCTVRWYDNFTSEQTKGYYIYYWNMLASAPTYYQADEKLWGWNGVNVNEFTEIQDEWDSRAISKKDCEGTACIAITESGSGGTAIWNISGLDTNENYLDSLYIRFTNKWNGSSGDSGLVSQVHRVTASADSLYDLFTYTGDAGCGWSGFYMRNKTSGDYKGSIDCVQLRIVKDAWYTQYSYYMIPSYYNYAVLYNSTGSWSNEFDWGSTFNSRSVGFRLYSGDNTDGDIAFIKDFEVGTLLINRNLTTSAGSEESYEESTTTTTNPATTTTTTTPETTTSTLSPTTTIDLGNAERLSWFCNGDNLVRNKTWWNETGVAYVYEYNISSCQYGCGEVFLLGTRCNFQPALNWIIGIAVIVLMTAFVMYMRGVMGW